MTPYSYGAGYTPVTAQNVTAGALNFGPPAAPMAAPGVPLQAPVPVPVPNQPVDPLGSALINGGVGGVQLQGGYGAPVAGGPMSGLGGLWKGMGGMDGFSSLLEGLGGLGQVYTSLKGLGLAKDQLKFQRESYQTNLANQTQSYNTALEDRIRARYHTEGRSSADVDSYLKKHSL